MRRLQCAEIWGGVKNEDVDVCSPGMTVSLYSSAADGGKGGDVYYFSLCSHDRVTRLALADVMGHGEQVSRISQWIYEQMAARLDDPDLPGMVAELNRRVIEQGGPTLTTALFLSYYVDLKEVYFCDAGHHPILARRQDQEWEPITSSERRQHANLPLGVVPDVHYDMPMVSLARGDRLLLYTDGVVEAPSASGELFGAERLRSALSAVDDVEPMNLKSRLLEGLRGWTGGGLDHDDVTLIALRVD